MASGTGASQRASAATVAFTRTLEAAAGLDALFAAQLGREEQDRSWVTLDRLCTNNAQALATALDAVEQNWPKRDRTAAGSILLYEYTWSVVANPLACYLVRRRVPDISSDNIAVRFEAHAPGVGLAYRAPHFAVLADDPDSAAAAVVLPDEGRLRAWFLERLLDTHLLPLIDAIRGHSRASRRLQLGNVATVIANVFRFAYELRGDPSVLEDGNRLIAESSLAGHVEIDEFHHNDRFCGVVIRRTCCLSYRPTSSYCAACPLIDENERRQRWVARLS